MLNDHWVPMVLANESCTRAKIWYLVPHTDLIDDPTRHNADLAAAAAM